MKRVLIITYYWPPSGGSGVQRWLKFAKYLPKYGWQPVIYTPEKPDFSVKDNSLLEDIPKEAEILKTPIWEPYDLYRKLSGNKGKGSVNFGSTKSTKEKNLFARLATWVRGNLFIPDPRVFWVRPSVKYLNDYIKKHPVDAIITTGPPHSMHLIALKLKQQHPNLNWIADMRDPWANFDILNEFNLGPRAKAKQNKLEQRVLNESNAVIMVSPSLAEEFNDFDHSKIALINNGYDAADFETLNGKPGSTNNNIFKIYHTGLLNYIRNPAAFWEALIELSNENPDFEAGFQLELIGTVDEYIKRYINGNAILKNKVNLRGYMSHSNLLNEYAKADLFLLVVNKSRNAKAQITGKIYEYLAVGKPVLSLCPTNSDTAKLLEKTGLGIICAVDDKASIKQNLLNQFTLFNQKKELQLNKNVIQQYTRENLTKKLVNTLENL